MQTLEPIVRADVSRVCKYLEQYCNIMRMSLDAIFNLGHSMPYEGKEDFP
jgi:hypothetical protein